MSRVTDSDIELVPSRTRPGTAYCLFDGAVVTDAELLDLYIKRLENDAQSSRPLYLSGEAGTGKRTMARTAHRWSLQPGELITVDCAGEKPDRLESALFGDARRGSDGALADAALGTLVLTDIDWLPLPLQARLDSESCRLLFTSRAPLAAAVRAGRFHPDLAKSVLSELKLPPLRRREHAVQEIFFHFVHAMGPHPAGWEQPTPDAAAFEQLLRRPWPGNVSELRSMVVALLMGGKEGVVTARDLQLVKPGYYSRAGDLQLEPVRSAA